MLFKIDQIWYLICIYISSHTFMVACCYKNNMFINKHETLQFFNQSSDNWSGREQTCQCYKNAVLEDISKKRYTTAS